MATKNDEFMNAYDTVHKMRKELGLLLDAAEDKIWDDNIPEVKRKAQHILDAILPIHEDLYQVEKDLKKD